ncbi:septation protein SepH [Streptacidiphilus sp. MAP5-3]|uniref:septation protein SepH n=1 Tax=unclassified Streptacidiphilus TaxID=2643834 RepID=UPI00351430B5
MTSAGTTREVTVPELRVVAVSNDGSRLVLKAADSTEYFLPIDERLRAAVRGDRPRLGQIDVESHLRPRDIQARIRAGATAEEVAQQAGISVERVRRFEGPVLAERAFMAERARKTSVRRAGESTGPQLGDAVAERLLLRGADKDSTGWDSWRRDDSTWEIVLSFAAEGAARQARWTYDPPRRLVQPLDDEARALIGETPERVEEPTFPFVPRIARLPGADRGMGMRPHAPERTPVERVPVERVPVERVPVERVPIERKPIERPTGERTAGDRTAEPPAASAAASASSPSALVSQVGPVTPVDSLTSILDVATPGAVSDESSESVPVEPEAPAAAAVGAGSAYADILMPRTASPHRDRLVGSTDRQAEADGVRPGRRAAVPSWDEIVFGTRRKKQD